jgi:hypothetical protein
MTESSSPVCYAKDADPGYMGYLTHEELLSFLNRMLEAERAGARVGLHTARDAHDRDTKELARAILRDEARWCAMLRRAIREAAGGIPSEVTGAFYQKAVAIDDLAERLEFINRGQGWVVKRLREVLPNIRDDRLHGRLKAMLIAHEDGIRKVTTFQAASIQPRHPDPIA